MLYHLKYIAIGLLVLSPVISAPADIQPSQKRAAVVEQANQLAKVTPLEEAQLPDNIRSPFNPTAVEVRDTHLNRPASDKELLVILAEQLQPTGVMGREDSMVLLLKGQKGVKVNEKLTVSFDGTSYEVEVISIDRYNFSLRYNQAEITRSIKTGKNP